MIKSTLLLTGAASLLSCNATANNRHEKMPNIIYILADDLGYGDVRSYNPDSKIPTPNLDNMAANGVMFTDAHSSSAVSTPTRYSTLTGRYSWRTPLKSHVVSGYSKSLIQKDRTTVAHLLRQQGYSTAFIGKWHLGWDWLILEPETDSSKDILSQSPVVDFSKPIKNGPSTHGFDYSFGFSGSLDMPPYVWVENDMPTAIPVKETLNVDAKGFWRKGLTSDDFNHTNVLQDVTDKAKAYIHGNARKKKPFFLYLPLPAPHTPILPTTEFLGKSNTNFYGDFMMQVDDVVGQIREILRKEKISDNTILIFTSDNGCSPTANFKELEQVGHYPSAAFRGAKADIYEGGHRVPFIVEWPKGAAKNKKNSQIICSTDLFATCAELTNYNIKPNEGEDSYSFMPLLNGNVKTEIRPYTVHHSIDGSFAIRQGDWKLIFCAGSGGWSAPTPATIRNNNLNLPALQLYNLKDDVGERNNLIDVYPQKVLELKAAMAKIILDGRSTDGPMQQNEGMDTWVQIQSIIN